MNGQVEVISPFADNTGTFSLFELDSLQAIINTYQDLARNTGLKVNFEKSIIYRIGKSRISQ